MDIYIYYSIREHNAVLARKYVHSLQQRLTNDYGIDCGLKRRAEVIEDVQTWMEIYQSVPHNFDQVIEQLAAQGGLVALTQGSRHIETFVDIPPCV